MKDIAICCQDFVKTYLPNDTSDWKMIPESCYKDLKNTYPPEQWKHLHVGWTHLVSTIDIY